MKKSDFDLKHQNQTTESKIVASLEKISQAFSLPEVYLWHILYQDRSNSRPANSPEQVFGGI